MRGKVFFFFVSVKGQRHGWSIITLFKYNMHATPSGSLKGMRMWLVELF